MEIEFLSRKLASEIDGVRKIQSGTEFTCASTCARNEGVTHESGLQEPKKEIEE